MSEIYDITIIGGGPVGLFAALYGHASSKSKIGLIPFLNQVVNPSIL